MKFLAFTVACAFTYAANASEPWMYPLPLTPPATLEELNSQSLRTANVESLGVGISNNSSRTIHINIASFDDIAKWYSDKLGGTDLPSLLTAYDERTADAPESSDGHAKIMQPRPSGHVAYRFTPTHKQVTFLHLIPDGDAVAVSLLGTRHETSIQVVRRHADKVGLLSNP